MKNMEDNNLFMICSKLRPEALTGLPEGYYIRNCRRDEYSIWKAMPFDDEETAAEYDQYMDQFFNDVYGNNIELFFEKTVFACNSTDQPVGTCAIWKAYGMFQTIHWWKVLKSHEGKGIGRALLSHIMRNLRESDYPVYLHTQAGSYRAIKLYSDFGFSLLSDKNVGCRRNDIIESLPYLQKHMPASDFERLQICKAPTDFINKLAGIDRVEF